MQLYMARVISYNMVDVQRLNEGMQLYVLGICYELFESTERNMFDEERKQ